jgi:hypothetical protein
MAKSEYWLKMAEEDLKDASLDIECKEGNGPWKKIP